MLTKHYPSLQSSDPLARDTQGFPSQDTHGCIDNNGHRADLTEPRRVCQAGQGPWALAPPFENPPSSAAGCIRWSSGPIVIATMAFAVAFGFLSGATSPSAHYDPYMFAIGVSSLFGAACGAIGILISRIRQMKAELRTLEASLDAAADRNWEIREAQERTASFFEAQDDVIVRRNSLGADYLRQRRVLRARRPRPRSNCNHQFHAASSGARRDHSPGRWHAHP